nr:hypothetical protein 9 [Desulfobacteraceae bacterium]
MPDDNEKRLSGPSMDDDDFSGLYMLSRQVAEEWHGPAMSALRRHSMPENDGLVRARGKDGKMPGADLKPSASHQVEKIRRGDAPLEDPWIDPVMAGTAGFGAAAKIGLSTGMKLMPSLGRAITAGVVSAGADVPVGAATEQVAGDSAAAPFVNLLFGAASGVGVERALEDTIMRLAGGSGARSAAKLIGNVKAELLSGEVKSAVGKQVENEISLVRKAVESGETVDSPWYEPVKKILQSEEGAVYLEMSGKKVPGSGVPAKEGMQKAGQAVAAAKPERLPKYAGNVNLSNIADETGDSLKQLIFATSKELSPELKKARRGVRSWAKTEAASRSYSLQDLLGRKIGEAYNAEQIENARSTLITSASNLKYYRDKILSKEATDADKFEFQKAFNLHYAIQSQVAGAAAEAGRALQVFRKLATEDSVRLKEMDEMMQAMGRAKDPETLARLMESFDDAAQIGKFVEQAQRATSTDMLLEAWINGLLSGPQTHAVNMTSNALVALW